MQSLSKYQQHFHRTRTHNPKICMEPQKIQIAKAILKKKSKAEDITILDFKYITKLYPSRQYGTGTKIDT